MKKECLINNDYFSLTSVPDYIVRKSYSRDDFKGVTKMLLFVKEAYLKKRAEKDEQEAERARKEAEMNNMDKSKQTDDLAPVRADPNLITDEDEIEKRLLDDYMSRFDHKFATRKEIWSSFIYRCKEEAKKKCDYLKVDANKTKQ